MGKKTLFPRSRFLPGFRFHPTDVELIMYYLKRKVLGKKIMKPLAISEVDIYKYAPWDLQHKSCWSCGDLKWYFFCPAAKKYANGGRMKRSTDLGYWKTTGKDRPVQYNNEVVGMIKTLVFHRGKAPKGTRTDWVMYEYRLEDKKLADGGVIQDSYVLCMLFEKEGPGPKNGAQYGAPFREEDWENDDEDDDDEEEEVMEELKSGVVVSPVDITTTSVVQVTPALTKEPRNICTMAFAPCPLQTLPSTDVHVPEVSNIDEANVLVPEVSNIDETILEAPDESPDELDKLLADFSHELPFNFDEIANFENNTLEVTNGGMREADKNAEVVDFEWAEVDEENIYSGLGELNNSSGLGDYGDFLEILDMTHPMDCQPHPSVRHP